MPDDNSECEPPDPIPNSEVKVLSADGSVGFPHVRVGHRQASQTKGLTLAGAPFFIGWNVLVGGQSRAACMRATLKGDVQFSAWGSAISVSVKGS